MKTADKYGIIRVVSRWLDLLPKLIGMWRIFIGYAAVLTVCAIVLNRWSYACHGEATGFWCNWYGSGAEADLITIILWIISAFCFYCLFAADFYKNLISPSNFKLSDIFVISKQKLRSLGIFFGFLTVIIICCGILIYIINPTHIPSWHGANPDWRIEFLYFTVAFICTAFPLLILRCSGIIACFFNEGSFPLKKIYDLTFGRAYVGIFCFFLLVLFCLNMHVSIMHWFNRITNNYNFLLTAFVTEFGNNLMLLLYVSLFLLLFQSEYLVLKGTQAETGAAVGNVKAAENIYEPDLPVVARQAGKTKKSAAKKKSKRKNSKTAEKRGIK